MSKRTRFIALIAATALASLLIGSFLLPAPALSQTKKATENSGSYVYARMDEVYDSLQNYLQTGDAAQFEAAETELTKAAAVCEAYGAYYGYRGAEDMADDAIHGWCVAFMRWAGDRLREMDPNQLLAAERADVESIAMVFAPVMGVHNFFGMAHQFGQSPLVDDERFQKAGIYDWNGVLIMPVS